MRKEVGINEIHTVAIFLALTGIPEGYHSRTFKFSGMIEIINGNLQKQHLKAVQDVIDLGKDADS